MNSFTNQPIKQHKQYFQYQKDTLTHKPLKYHLNKKILNPSFISTSSVESHRRIQSTQPKKKLTLSQYDPTYNYVLESSSRGTINSLSQKTMSYQYKYLKPIISWKKYTHLLCGMERGQGNQGCTCDQPCRWMKKWTLQQNHRHYKLFKNLPLQTINHQTFNQIQKDVPRTHSDCPSFQTDNFKDMLREVLVSYSVYDPQVGYVQGINIIVGVLLYHIKNSCMTFWAFVDLMEDQELRMIYLDGFENLKQHCRIIVNILVTKVNDLYNLMKQLNVQCQAFLHGWLLSFMSNCIPLEYMHFVVDNFKKTSWKFMYQLVITYLLYIKQVLLRSQDSCEFFQILNNANAKQLGIEWHQMIESSQKLSIDFDLLQL